MNTSNGRCIIRGRFVEQTHGRQPGGRGRSSQRRKKDPQLPAALAEMVEGETAGDSMSELKWQRSSLGHLSQELTKTGHPDRDQQFEHIESLKAAFLTSGRPVIRVDSKKKELIGNFKNNG